ncbi:MAG: hypothetical protein RSE20_10265, partial [Eubacterium sp.]
QNSNAIKDASQGSAGELEMDKGTVMENAPKFIDATGLEPSTSFKIDGEYYAATKKKSNDQTEVSQTMFKAVALTPPPIPTVTVDNREAKPLVPKNGKEEEDAYYSDDNTIGDHSFFQPNGNLMAQKNEAFYPFRNKKGEQYPTYVQTYGQLHKGVIKTTRLSISMGTVNVPPDEHLEQLFFTKSIPFENNVNGDLIYHTKFVYIGADSLATSNGIEITVGYDENDKVDPNKTTSLIFESYSEAQETTILYLPQKFNITCKKISEEIVSNGSLDPGFYLLPDKTDILKTGYDQDFHTKFMKDYYVKDGYTMDQLQYEMKITPTPITP